MLTIAPSSGLRGEVDVPGDKSLSHRAALFATLTPGESHIEHFLVAGVTERMIAALRKLDVRCSLSSTTLKVTGGGLGALTPPSAPLDCGHSATTLRLLAGAIAAAGIPAVLDGSSGLRQRPMSRIVDPLTRMGVAVTAVNGRAPLTFQRRTQPTLSPGIFKLPVASAQVKSCLLLAGLAASGPVEVIEPGPSRDHSERLLQHMGARIETDTITPSHGQTHNVTRILPGDVLHPLHIRLPGDLSTAAFLIVAAIITPNSEITIRRVGLNPTRTGLLNALKKMGADLVVTQTGEEAGEPFGEIRARSSDLHGTVIEGELVVRMIDEFPAFGIAAARARGVTTVQNAAELRYKETDRIAAITAGLNHLGVPATERQDGFTIPGGYPFTGGQIDPRGDHRMAMAFALAGLVASTPVSVWNAEIIHQSYPQFAETLQALGAEVL